ncbi:RNase A-like domain-containing protein [Utexia brackfieldae]|uniref:RNase A-like domain-containing protein n=1 Tax=Utexia brackfieldae TaxID=3074108 RepID=UPI00370D3EC4
MKRNLILLCAVVMLLVGGLQLFTTNSEHDRRIDAAPASTSESKMAVRVPGGGLQTHEKLGGHLIKQHVAKTEQQLNQRIAREPITSASAFYDLATAEMAVAQAIKTNQSKINAYLQHQNTHYLAINYRAANPVGILVTQRHPTAIAVSGVKVILAQTTQIPLGYRIVTGYPSQ